MSDSHRQTCFISAAAMADRLGVKASAVRRGARRGDIPKLVLPSGRFVFDPVAVIASLKRREGRAAEVQRG
jgi:predicted site-specific integrase-resolvase